MLHDSHDFPPRRERILVYIRPAASLRLDAGRPALYFKRSSEEDVQQAADEQEGRRQREPAGKGFMLTEGMAKAQIVTVLRGYAHDINRISALMPRGGTPKEAQSRLKQLKDAIHSDYKHRYAIARSTQLTPLEQANLARAIRDVFFTLQAIGVNTTPGREWRNALYGADLCIHRFLTELRGHENSVESDITEWL